MAYFPDQLLKCVAFVGYKDQHDKYRLAGSGFWISRGGPSDVKHMQRLAYFVTAAHVIDKVREESADKSVWLRANTQDGGHIWHKTPAVCWKNHPTDSTVDVAVLKIGIDDKMDQVSWPLENCILGDNVDTAETGNRKVELGDELCFAGLFYPHKGEKRNIPLVRIGNVSALRNEPVLNKDGVSMDVYLVEAHSIGGLSGSPVFMDVVAAKQTFPPSWGQMAGWHMPNSISRFKLFGAIHGHFGDDIEVDGIADDGKRKVAINLGIAMVIPTDKIVEVLMQFDKEEESEASEARMRPFGGAGGSCANSTFQTSFDPKKV